MAVLLASGVIASCGQPSQEAASPSDDDAASEPAGVVNVYSARHYDTDDDLYDSFTEQTGIEINLIEGKSDELIERIKAEGEASPADVFITADAGRLWRADEEGLLQPVSSELQQSLLICRLRSRSRWIFNAGQLF